MQLTQCLYALECNFLPTIVAIRKILHHRISAGIRTSQHMLPDLSSGLRFPGGAVLCPYPVRDQYIHSENDANLTTGEVNGN
jgi:hypothetical protein